jgi:hypothetical protein
MNIALASPPTSSLGAAKAVPDFCRTHIAPGVSPGRGRGLFATGPIPAGELIERCCSIPLTSPQCDALEGILPLGDYYFRHPVDPEQGLLLLGLMSLANHSDEPNARIGFTHAEGVGWIAELTATRAIAAGEEITHRYRCAPWFEVS